MRNHRLTRAVDIHAERAYSANVNKRIHVLLPEGTIALLDRLTTKGNRSRFIDAAVLRFVEAGGRESLREQLEVFGSSLRKDMPHRQLRTWRLRPTGSCWTKRLGPVLPRWKRTDHALAGRDLPR